jgi:hypothetical protein
MNPEQTELFRLAVLRVLDANRTRYGLGVSAICLHLVRFGFVTGTFAGEEAFRSVTADALQYLCDHALAEEVLEKVMSAANRCWRITTRGIDYIDTRG